VKTILCARRSRPVEGNAHKNFRLISKEEKMHPLARCLIAAALAFALAPPAWAQAWPVKPIRLVVGFSAGSSPDMIARMFATQLGEALGQTIVVENRGGAGGNIAVESVARSAPDGYTLLHTAGGPLVVGVHLYKFGVDVVKDLVPVTPTARTTMYLVVRPGLPVHSVAELIAYARANPGKLNYGSAGSGSGMHIAAEMFVHAARIQVTHVPYKGAPQVITDLLGDKLDFAFDLGVSIPQIKANKLRLLAVPGAARSPVFPDTPTMAEAGTDMDMGATNVFGIYAPSGTPREIIARLNREVGRIMQTAEVRASLFAGIGAEVVTATPEEFAALLRRERERFGAIVRAANIRVD
jgi:tripartite-type tricarboxylate transporter receptor subunit TctC